MTKSDFTSKVAIVTGGGGILCGMFCKALAQAGAQVAVLDISQVAADKVAAEIREGGGNAIGVACDVLNEESLRGAERKVYAAFGQYHILINGAGGAPATSCTTGEQAVMETLDAPLSQENTLFNLPSEIIASVLNLNCMGTFNVTKVFAKRMAGVDGAVILNISSMSAISPLTKQVAYSAGKAAVSNLTQWLSTHLADVGIRVNAIAPGFFATNINRHLLFGADGSLSERSRKIVAGTPMGRFGAPEELLGAMMFLCDSQSSSFVTGVILPVDGGFSSYCGV